VDIKVLAIVPEERTRALGERKKERLSQVKRIGRMQPKTTTYSLNVEVTQHTNLNEAKKKKRINKQDQTLQSPVKPQTSDVMFILRLVLMVERNQQAERTGNGSRHRELGREVQGNHGTATNVHLGNG